MKLCNRMYIRRLLLLTAVCCGFIWSFTNLSYDGEYQIAMSYRMLQGDRLFLEMWEPHQTSAFLPAALMWIYVNVFRTTTGIVVYMQLCGILIRAAIALLLYRILKNDIDEPVAFGIALLYFMLSPKDYALPEFSNQQLWYGTLVFCCLWSYLKKGKWYFLALGAVSLCMEVLSYPSALIVYPGAIIILWCYSGHSIRDIAVFTVICAALGLGFCYVFLPEWNVFGQCINGMLELEPSHTVSAVSKVFIILRGILEASAMMIAIAALGAVMGGVVYGINGKRGSRQHAGGKKFESKLSNIDWYACFSTQGGYNYRYALWLLCCAIIILVGFLINIISAEHRNAYGCVFLFLAGLGFHARNYLEGKERQIYVCGSIIGSLGFIATLILTDLPVTDSVVYGLVAIIFALIPLGKQVKRAEPEALRKGIYVCCVCFVLLLAFRCVYIRTPLTGRGQICTIFSDMSIVRTGPAMGLISNEDGVCIQRDSRPEWKELIRRGDKVWMVGCILDTLGYLYEDVEVAAPSTMSTPTYNSAVLDYWRLNPEKYPDVVVVEGYMGDMAYELEANQWFMSWLEEEYKPEYVVEGKYWIYYFKEER